MNIRNLAKKIAPLAVALSLTVPSTAFAAETNGDTNANVPSVEQTAEDSGIALYSTFNPGDNYLGYVTVTRTGWRKCTCLKRQIYSGKTCLESSRFYYF